MDNFTIVAAQSSSVKGNIEANIATHAKFVRMAVEHHTDVIIFPELSLTGYEPEIAHEILININDQRLTPLKGLAESEHITIVAGAPIVNPGSKPYIGALIFAPSGLSVYIKNYLHAGEEGYFSPGAPHNCILQKNDEKVGIAICADINHPDHAKQAAKGGASVYAAGVLMMGGYDEAAQLMQRYATEHSMVTLMANYASPTGGYIPAGKSAVWNPYGKLLARADETGEALVLSGREDSRWFGRVISL